MSDNPFEEYVNSLHEIDFLTDGEIAEILSSQELNVPGHGTIHERDKPGIFALQCTSCGLQHFGFQGCEPTHCRECGADMRQDTSI